MSVYVVYGADEETFDTLVGMEFDNVVSIVRQAMSIPSDITDVRLNGQSSVMGTKIIKDNDVISFYKRSGTKGYY